jgi:hypothetical protein
MQTKTEHDRQEQFEHTFGAAPEVVVRSPGRVNLIGDHTDYHEGFVMPMAIDRSILLYGRRRTERRVRIRSNTLDAGIEIDLGSDERHQEPWAHYFQGVVSVLGARHPLANGCDVLIDADLPPGGGLSSSSALVVGFGALLARLNGIDLAPFHLANVMGRRFREAVEQDLKLIDSQLLYLKGSDHLGFDPPGTDREDEQVRQEPVQLLNIPARHLRFSGDALPGVRHRAGRLLPGALKPRSAARVRQVSGVALRGGIEPGGAGRRTRRFGGAARS